jgi:hypothetical protein
MSKCAICHGSGSVACAVCEGMGYTLEEGKDEDLIRHLCTACKGRPLHNCPTCHGTGVLDKAPPVVGEVAAVAEGAAPRTPGHTLPDRLAGRWKGDQGTWYEFVPDGDGRAYHATTGGPMGISGTGTAVIAGRTVRMEASDKLLGPYELELLLNGTHLEGIDRKAGYPIPVSLTKA